MSRRKKIILITSTLLLSTLACRAATSLIVPDTPTLPAENCVDESCLNSCLERINNVIKTQPYQPLPDAYAGSDASINLVLYKIQDNDLLEPRDLWVPSGYKAYQQDAEAHQRIWRFYREVIPPALRVHLVRFMVYTDGEDNSLAWVKQDENAPETWEVGIDILDSQNPLYLTSSIIHETGHLITLNSDQVTFGYYSGTQNQAQCPQFVLPNGCSKPDSYINRFYQRFWVHLFDEWWDKVLNSSSEADFEKVRQDFYRTHPDQFISSYATTNIKEDMAETFEYFVLNPKPNGNSIVEAKVNFFYELPELVDSRQQIIKGLCTYLPHQ